MTGMVMLSSSYGIKAEKGAFSLLYSRAFSDTLQFAFSSDPYT